MVRYADWRYASFSFGCRCLSGASTVRLRQLVVSIARRLFCQSSATNLSRSIALALISNSGTIFTPTYFVRAFALLSSKSHFAARWSFRHSRSGHQRVMAGLFLLVPSRCAVPTGNYPALVPGLEGELLAVLSLTAHTQDGQTLWAALLYPIPPWPRQTLLTLAVQTVDRGAEGLHRPPGQARYAATSPRQAHLLTWGPFLAPSYQALQVPYHALLTQHLLSFTLIKNGA